MTGPNGNGFGPFGGARSAPPRVLARGNDSAPPHPPDLGKSLSLQSWDQQKPPTAQDFYSFTQTSLVLPAAVNGTVSTTAATGGFIQLPPDNVGVLQTVIFTIDAPATTMNFRFSVLANGGGIPGLTNIGFPPLNASTFAFPLNSTWQLQQGVTVSVVFTNAAATGPWTLGVVLSGYQVSASDILYYTGQRVGQLETHNERFRENLAR